MIQRVEVVPKCLQRGGNELRRQPLMILYDLGRARQNQRGDEEGSTEEHIMRT